MTQLYDVGIALGGTNIEERMNPVVASYLKGETPVAMFVGKLQGEEAAEYFSSHGIPPYSRRTGDGYIAQRNDWSATTIQNAIIAKRFIEELDLGERIFISTELHHGARALKEFKRILPNPYHIDLVTVGQTIQNPKELMLRILHEPISIFFDLFYSDLPKAAHSDRQLNQFYVRDKKMQIVYDLVRDWESKIYMLMGSSSQNKLVGIMVDEDGNLL